MRKPALLLATALALALASSPARADEAYVELTGGLSWNGEGTDAISGIAGGYDVDLDERFFVGVEAVAEKLLVRDTRVAWGIGGRIGVELVRENKLFIGANWQSKDCRECSDAIGIGTGWEHNLTEKLYLKIEYKRLLIGNGEPDANVGILGIGVMF
ncbi:hypothetical protein N6H05_11145 [Sphingobium sp. WTD-1]|uniref:outer membrane beta-barrel protein n=1 Tax=Sphingobium sp. WTD-1 TaxID=2979467 RepID=UPI0024DEEEE1|nr:outer membrane beta-barrel protein [Sphingobium sp. WTD-1]WIA58317.1 hypothetical protein N6H05_11145 [Sphingobium sp. WTD-1]